MDTRYDVRRVTRYVLVHESGNGNVSSSDDLAQFGRRDRAVMAGKALTASPELHREHERATYAKALGHSDPRVREMGALALSRIDEPSEFGAPDWGYGYAVKPVARYVLYRVSGDEIADICEFGRQDEANAVLNAIKGAAGDGLTDDTEKFSMWRGGRQPKPQAGECIRIGKDVAISLFGLDRLDTASALDVLEARVANTKECWKNKASGNAKRQDEANRATNEKFAGQFKT